MDEYNFTTQDGWEYGTGRTQPPKNRGGMVALLLILVIFLIGIITVLGILNIRLFRQLNAQEQAQDLSISFTQLQETTPDPQAEAVQQTEPENNFSIQLETTPQATPNVPQQGGLSLQEIYRKNIPSVVSISCTLHSGSSSGTGVVLSEEGYIVTNAHVVDGAVSVTVQLTDDRMFPARIVGTDTISDLAVLYIEADSLTAATFGDSDQLQVGDSVAAIGDPLGVELRGTMTNGIISAINRDVSVDGRTMNLIQTNAALNSGNSGGPLIDCYGNVIGINTMKIGDHVSIAGVEGLGFAIPSATVKSIVDQLVSQGYVSGRPTLGMAGEALSVFYQHYYHLPAGLYLTEVEEGSPAHLAGIQEGDILLSIDGVEITSMDSLNRLLYAHQVGDEVTVTVYRAGKQGSAKLIIAEDKT